MKVVIPLSIKKRFARERTIRLSFFLCFLILLVVLFVFFDPLSKLKGINKVLTFGFCFAFDVILTGVPFKLIRRNWQGEIVDIKVRTSVDSLSSVNPVEEMRYTANTVVLKVKTPKGETISVEAEKSKVRYSESSIERYEIGDCVARVDGVDYLAHYKHSTKQVRCVMCGGYSATESGSCTHCDSDLVLFTTSQG